MNKLKFNPDNKKYYSEEFVKGFECGVEIQFNADMKENTAEWIKQGYGIGYRCTNCGKIVMADDSNELNFCCNCGRKMKGENQ